MSDLERIQTYIRTRDEYWKNAKDALGDNEYRKAAELIWGAIAQELRLVGAWAAPRARTGTHQQLVAFVQELTKATGDVYFWEEFRTLQTLHDYFYEATKVDPFELPKYLARAERYIARLEQLRQIRGEGGQGPADTGSPGQ